MMRWSHHSIPALLMILGLVDKLGEMKMPSSYKQMLKMYINGQGPLTLSLTHSAPGCFRVERKNKKFFMNRYSENVFYSRELSLELVFFFFFFFSFLSND